MEDQMSRDMTKPTKWVCAQQRPVCPVRSESSLCAELMDKDPSFQTGRMPRLIWVFAGRTLILLVLSCRGSNLIRPDSNVMTLIVPYRWLWTCLCPVHTWAATWQNQQSDYAPSEDSDQPWHAPSLIRVFADRTKKVWLLNYPLSAQRRLWSDWPDAQADLSLRWAHNHFVGFVMSRLAFSSNITINCVRSD